MLSARALLLLALGLAACRGAGGGAASVPGAKVSPPYDSAPSAAVSAALGGAPLRLGTEYDAAIPTPDDCLGHPVGARAAAPDKVVACFRLWAERSKRVVVAPYATTFEGRELVRVVITSPANHARLDAILADVAALAEPRARGAAAAVDRVAKSSPVVAWFGYSVHGDEMSGVDGSTVFGYHLIAGTDKETQEILDRVVVVIDPVMNPDGRSRILTQLAQAASEVPSLNFESMHRGWWPYGRGNHYLFDLNRDWIVGAMPETQGRWRELLRFRPQLVVDVHEMSALDSYLFYPRSAPHNPGFPATASKWHEAFATDQAAAFDAGGWPYYTREWADGWYPGYGDAWSELRGAVGILYEQARSDGMAVKRPSGRVMTYRETVLHQAVSSLANLRTAARNREALLRDFAAHHRAFLGDRRVFAIAPGRAPDRERHLLATLMRQGVEVHRASAAFSAHGVSASGGKARTQKFPAGTLLVAAGQPAGGLVRALLDFDPRMDRDFLVKEREELERKGESKLYDISAWNLGMAYGVDAWWLDGASVARAQVTAIDEVEAGAAAAPAGTTAVGWLVDGRLDSSLAFAVAALERGLFVHAADRPFTSGKTRYAAGTVLVRRAENPADVDTLVAEAARAAGVLAQPASTARSPDEGPDLGGQHFRRLVRPRVAILSNAPIDIDVYGHIWYLLDRELKVPVTLIETMALEDHDLRRYNVLIVPPGGEALEQVLEANKKQLAAWVKSGGTLVALGGSAALVADKKLGLSEVRRRSDVLEELELYAKAAAREMKGRKIEVDVEKVWNWKPEKKKPEKEQATGDRRQATGDRRPEADSGEKDDREGDKDEKEDEEKEDGGEDGGEDDESPGKKEAEAEDEWLRRFQPRGAILRGLVAPDFWLGFGAAPELPVLVTGDHVLLARSPVVTAVRLDRPETLRLSGLLWPEGRTTWALSAWATVEAVGDGQVILFSTPPVLRMLFRGTARLLGNAVVLGPAMGASQPLEW